MRYVCIEAPLSFGNAIDYPHPRCQAMWGSCLKDLGRKEVNKPQNRTSIIASHRSRFSPGHSYLFKEEDHVPQQPTCQG